jgi:hypothetical protein
VRPGDRLIVDGTPGVVVVRPNAKTLTRYEDERRRAEHTRLVATAARRAGGQGVRRVLDPTSQGCYAGKGMIAANRHANILAAIRSWPRVLCLAALALWAAPQLGIYLGNVDTCGTGCPEDENGGPPCPPVCANCGCAPNAARITDPLLADLPHPLVPVLKLWWPMIQVVSGGTPTEVFHPPKA